MEPSYIDALPEGLEIQEICPHSRNTWARDQTCFNPSKTKFVVAFNIYEVTVMNEMCHVAWGSSRENAAQVQGLMKERLAYCWEHPFAHWFDDDCFAIKVNGGNRSYPVVAIHLEKGFQVLTGSDSLETRASHYGVDNLSNVWLPTEKELLP